MGGSFRRILGGWSCNCFLKEFSSAFRALTEITWCSSIGIMGKAMTLMTSIFLADSISQFLVNWQTGSFLSFPTPTLFFIQAACRNKMAWNHLRKQKQKDAHDSLLNEDDKARYTQWSRKEGFCSGSSLFYFFQIDAKIFIHSSVLYAFVFPLNSPAVTTSFTSVSC